MTPTRALLIGAGGGLAAAVLLSLDRPGLGWPLTAVLVFALIRPARWGWAVLSVALFATGALVAAGWLFFLCAAAGCAAGSLAVVGGTTARGLVFGSAAVPLSTFRAVPWVARGFRTNSTLARPVLITAGLLAVFVPLLAGADAAFADLLDSVVPDDSVAPRVFLFLVVTLGVVGAAYLTVTPVSLDGTKTFRRTVARRDWALPVGALVVLFALFVAVQITTLFQGDLQATYAENARRGFWQLLAVTVLTLGVIAIVGSLARTETGADRQWLRGLLGALSVLTLVIVASALNRMWLYQQAYGFTVLRVVVSACELWLGVVYLLVLAAGVKLQGAWPARAIVGTGLAALVGLAALNPDRFIAERNIARWHETGKIDLRYLAGLSPDAVPAIATLPDGMRQCALRRGVMDDDWRTWNLARAQARDTLRTVTQGDCEW